LTPSKPTRCHHAARYQAQRKPRCLGGKGCDACWQKWNKLHPSTKLKNEIDPIPDQYIHAGNSWRGTDAMKKQEYNRRMGLTAEMMHAIASGDEAKVAHYLSNLAEDEQRWLNRRRARSVSLEVARDILFLRQFEELSASACSRALIAASRGTR
jgi:hypothetical protein